MGTAFFPAAGLLLGVVLWAVLGLPVPPLPRAALATILWTVLTGGLHEDAWADSMDAAWAPVGRERRLEILGDPRIGAHGLSATVLLLMARFAALTSVPPIAALAAPVLGRWAMVGAPALFRPVRATGLGGRFAEESRPLAATATAGLALALVLAVGSLAPGSDGPGVHLGMALVAAGAAGSLLGALLSRRFGGLTGDGYGAVGVIAELAALWAFLPWGWPT
jgi:adenosylcobinamide-GDP ribazoletransferase